MNSHKVLLQFTTKFGFTFSSKKKSLDSIIYKSHEIHETESPLDFQKLTTVKDEMKRGLISIQMATLGTISVEKQSGVGNDISKTSSHVVLALSDCC